MRSITRAFLSGSSLAALSALSALALSASLLACGGDDAPEGAASNEGNEELLTSAGFERALDAARERAGDEAEAVVVQVSADGARFELRGAEGPESLVYTGGELVSGELELVGPGAAPRGSFRLAEVDPAAMDAIRAGLAAAAGAQATPTVLSLAPLAGGELGWTIGATGGDAGGVVYEADADGSDVRAAETDTSGAGAGDEGAPGAAGGE